MEMRNEEQQNLGQGDGEEDPKIDEDHNEEKEDVQLVEDADKMATGKEEYGEVADGNGEPKGKEESAAEKGEKRTDDDDDDSPSFEKVLDELGMPGRFQIVQIGLSLVALVICSFMGLSVVFLGHTPDHQCKRVNDTELLLNNGLLNDSTAEVKYKSCDIFLYSNQSGKVKEVTSVTCPRGRDFFGAEGTTYVSEWDLVCEVVGEAGYSHSVFTMGQIIGGIVSSFIADRFGRKPVLVFSSFLSCLVESAGILSPSISVVYVARFFSGLCYMSVVTCSIVYAMEMVAPRHRQVYGVVMNLLWVFYVLVVAMVAYVLRNHNWRYFQAIGAVSGLIFLVFPCLLKESPRWLSANNRTEEALVILELASKQNGKDFEVVKEKYNAYIAHAFPDSGKETCISSNSGRDEVVKSSVTSWVVVIKTRIVNSSLLTVLRNKTILFRIVVASVIWITNILTYFGLYISSSTLAGDRFLNFVLMDLVEIPSMVLLLFMLNRLGRRVVLAFFMITTALAMMVSALLLTFGRDLAGAEIATTCLFILGKFTISASFSVVYILTPELFPTNVRSTASGLCNSFGRLGSTLAPFLNPLHSEAEWAPALLLTSVCLLSLLLVVLLPETKDKDLPNTVEEMMRMQQQQKHPRQGQQQQQQQQQLQDQQQLGMSNSLNNKTASGDVKEEDNTAL